MKRLSALSWTAIAFLATASLLYGSWRVWLLTRTERPVSMPVSLAAGTIKTPVFTVNLSRRYDIAIQVANRFSPEAVICMTGLPLDPAMVDCDPARRRLQANWTVWSNNAIVAQGSTGMLDRLDTMTDRWEMDLGRYAQPGLERPLGSFDAQGGKSYSVVVTITQFQPSLAAADPHLRVNLDPLFTQNAVALNSIFCAVSLLSAAVGTILLFISVARCRRQRSQEMSSAARHAA